MPDNRGLGQKWLYNPTRCAIYARDRFACVYCGLRSGTLTVDHVEPFGGNAHDNLVTACGECNGSKGSRSLGTWLLAREAAGEADDVLDAIRQRVAFATFMPIDRALGRRLEKQRGRGAGSFAALATVLDAEEAAHAAE